MIRRFAAVAAALFAGQMAPAQMPSIADLENRSKDGWTSLGNSDVAAFTRQATGASSVMQSELQTCSKKVGDNYRAHPDYFAKLEDQRRAFVQTCKSNCQSKAADASSPQCSAMRDYANVLNSCMTLRKACEGSVPASAQGDLLKCDCDDLCQDPQIQNPASMMAQCAEGFMSIYKMFWDAGAAAVDGVQAAVKDPSVVQSSAQSLWRSLTSAASTTFDSSASIERQSSELAAMGQRLAQCRAAATATPSADYIASKLGQLSLSCVNMPTRLKRSEDKMAYGACSLIAPVPPVFAAIKFAAQGRRVVAIYDAATAAGKAAINEIARAGVAISDKAAKVIAQGGPGLASLITKMGDAAMAKFVKGCESCAIQAAGASKPFLWNLEPEAEALEPDASGSGETCPMRLAREVLDMRGGEKAIEHATTVDNAVAVNNASANAHLGPAFEENLGSARARAAADNASATRTAGVDRLQAAETEMTAGVASASSLATAKNAPAYFAAAQKQLRSLAQEFNPRDLPLGNLDEPTREKITETLIMSVEAGMRGGQDTFAKVQHDVEDLAAANHEPVATTNDAVNKLAQSHLDDAKSSAGYQNSSRMADIQAVQDYATFLRAQALRAGKPTAEFDALLRDAQRRQDAYAMGVQAGQSDVAAVHLRGYLKDVTDARSRLNDLQSRIDANPYLASDSAAAADLQKLKDTLKQAQDEYARHRSTLIDRLSPDAQSQFP